MSGPTTLEIGAILTALATVLPVAAALPAAAALCHRRGKATKRLLDAFLHDLQASRKRVSHVR